MRFFIKTFLIGNQKLKMNLRINIIQLFFLRLIKSIISIWVLVISLRIFGISVDRDIWILVINSILVIDLAFWGPINETFRSKFIFIKEHEGEKIALNKTITLFYFICAITSLIILLLFAFPSSIIRVMAPLYYNTHKKEVILMIRLICPSMLLNQFVLLSTSVLNAYNKFLFPELAGIISGLITVILLVILSPIIHIYSLIISYYFGLFIYILFIIYIFKKLKIKNKINALKKIHFDSLKPFIIFALPFYLPYSIGQINSFLEKSLANTLGPGKVSIIDYSRKFIDIPVNALSSVLLSILLPILTSYYAKNKLRYYQAELLKIIQAGLLLTSLVVGSIILNSHSLVILLYGNKNLNNNDFEIIVKLVEIYSLSIICIFLYSITGIALISQNKGKIYAIFGFVAQILMILLNFIFYKSYNLFIFPISLCLSHFVASAFQLYFLGGNRKLILFNIFCYIAYIPIIILFIHIIFKYFIIYSPLGSLLLKSSIYFISLILVIYIFKLREYKILNRLFNKIFRSI